MVFLYSYYNKEKQVWCLNHNLFPSMWMDKLAMKSSLRLQNVLCCSPAKAPLPSKRTPSLGCVCVPRHPGQREGRLSAATEPAVWQIQAWDRFSPGFCAAPGRGGQCPAAPPDHTVGASYSGTTATAPTADGSFPCVATMLVPEPSKMMHRNVIGSQKVTRIEIALLGVTSPAHVCLVAVSSGLRPWGSRTTCPSTELGGHRSQFLVRMEPVPGARVGAGTWGGGWSLLQDGGPVTKILLLPHKDMRNLLDWSARLHSLFCSYLWAIMGSSPGRWRTFSSVPSFSR